MKEMSKKATQEAFAGESMAHIKYLIFSEVAKKEGYANIARLFRAISYAEFIHAKNHAKNIGIIKNTKENLMEAIKGEKFEVDEMYPVYLQTARMQGEKMAERAFHYAVEAEKIHAAMYEDAMKMAEEGKDIEIGEIYICPICGYTHIGKVNECPVCGYKGDFEKF